MKIRNSIPFGALLIVGLLVTAPAQAHPGRGRSGGFHGARMFEALQLSDQQKATIDGLFTASRENSRALHQRMREQHQILTDATQTQPFDEAAVRFQAQELAKLQAEMMVQRAALMNQVSSVLSAEQKAKLAELKEQRKARFQEWRERHRSQPSQQQG